MMTPRQYAKHHDIPYSTLMTWLGRGLIPAAEKKETDIGHYWLIPSDAPKPEPKIGRPLKISKSETDGKDQ